jgi:hypothetical protein
MNHLPIQLTIEDVIIVIMSIITVGFVVFSLTDKTDKK